MINEQTISLFVDELRLNGNSEATVRAYEGDLRWAWSAIEAAGQIGNDWKVIEHALATFLYGIRNDWSPATINRRVSAWRSFAKRQGYTLLPNYRLPKPPPPVPHPIPEGIEGVKAMIDSTKNTQHRAMLALNGLLGLRITEVRSVRPSHFNLNEKMLLVRGKGDKSRRVPISPYAWEVIEPQYERCLDNDGLLVPITDKGARAAVTRHGVRAGLSRHVSSHDLRATLGTAFYRKTKDLRATQETLGHASAITTQRYTEVDIATQREGVDL